MEITLQPKKLKGEIAIPPSKSILHRTLICSFLAGTEPDLSEYVLSKDIIATRKALRNLKYGETVDCGESGSTLRFLIPVACALGLTVKFTGSGRLPERPLVPYFRELSKKGITFSEDKLPFTVSGKLESGFYEIEGNISSQFISGLMFALPLIKGNSRIRIIGTHESQPYTEMTINCIRKQGVKIAKNNGEYLIKGNQKYIPGSINVEADYSQAAFFLAANFLGSNVKITNLPKKSIQGDSAIVLLLNLLKHDLNESVLDIYKTLNVVQFLQPEIKDALIRAVSFQDVPDLVPIFAVASCFAKNPVKIVNAERLRIKESDRLSAMCNALNAIGGNVRETEDGLLITPVSHFTGGTIDSVNDHRIAMALAIASTKSIAPITITGAECVEKSYPDFWSEFERLSGGE
jgi:3-phosphoshikimate 1-carboxyvinyltransferase